MFLTGSRPQRDCHLPWEIECYLTLLDLSPEPPLHQSVRASCRAVNWSGGLGIEVFYLLTLCAPVSLYTYIPVTIYQQTCTRSFHPVLCPSKASKVLHHVFCDSCNQISHGPQVDIHTLTHFLVSTRYIPREGWSFKGKIRDIYACMQMIHPISGAVSTYT